MSNLMDILQSAYTFVRSEESNKAASSITLDHIISDRISRLQSGSSQTIIDAQGNNIGSRPSRYDYLDNLEKQLDDAVTAIENAGDDAAKLAALGLTDIDSETNDGSS